MPCLAGAPENESPSLPVQCPSRGATQSFHSAAEPISACNTIRPGLSQLISLTLPWDPHCSYTSASHPNPSRTLLSLTPSNSCAGNFSTSHCLLPPTAEWVAYIQLHQLSHLSSAVSYTKCLLRSNYLQCADCAARHSRGDVCVLADCGCIWGQSCSSATCTNIRGRLCTIACPVHAISRALQQQQHCLWYDASLQTKSYNNCSQAGRERHFVRVHHGSVKLAAGLLVKVPGSARTSHIYYTWHESPCSPSCLYQ